MQHFSIRIALVKKTRWIYPSTSYSPVKTNLCSVLSPKYLMYSEDSITMEFHFLKLHVSVCIWRVL